MEPLESASFFNVAPKPLTDHAFGLPHAQYGEHATLTHSSKRGREARVKSPPNSRSALALYSKAVKKGVFPDYQGT